MIYVLGGGAPLNYKVVGGTSAPSNPKENTIWVNTSTDITRYAFGANKPTGEEGIVWITTGTESAVDFDALKDKNILKVYPISAKQYVSGAWVDKTAKSYQGGEWVEWIKYTYLYNNKAVSGYTFGTVNDTETSKSSVSDKGTYVQLTGSSNIYAIFYVTPKVDVTNAKTLKMEVTNASMVIDANRCWFGLSSNTNAEGSGMNNKTVYASFSGSKTLSLDVSNISGTFYVALNVGTPASSSGGTFSARVTKIWLES